MVRSDSPAHLPPSAGLLEGFAGLVVNHREYARRFLEGWIEEKRQ